MAAKTKLAQVEDPKIRITKLADEHLQAIVDAINVTGMAVTKKGYLSQLILSQPIPEKGTADQKSKKDK